MHKIIALWATPRSTSTAFEWAMKNRGDMPCFHEPYNEAFYWGEDRRHDRYFKTDEIAQPTAGLTFESVHRELTELAKDGPVFVKDFGYSIMHLADDDFLDGFQHTFLIRNPEKVLTSMHSRWPDIEIGEIGFEELHRLFNTIAERTGVTPAVIDSDELLARPDDMMAAYCEVVGIPFIAEALNWEDQKEKNQDRDVTWNDDRHGFHDSLKASTGLAPQKRDYPPIDSDDRLKAMYDESLPHYLALYEHRLRLAPLDARNAG